MAGSYAACGFRGGIILAQNAWRDAELVEEILRLHAQGPPNLLARDQFSRVSEKRLGHVKG